MVPLVVVPAVLIASAGGGGGQVAHAPAGLFLGADGGAALMVGVGDDPTRIAAAFDVRTGYALRWGLTIHASPSDPWSGQTWQQYIRGPAWPPSYVPPFTYPAYEWDPSSGEPLR